MPKLKHTFQLLISSAVLVSLIGTYSHSQSNLLEGLTKEKATISKMDWILLNSRLNLLEKALRNDLSVPLSLSGQYYDQKKKKFKTGIKVDLVWLSKSSPERIKSTLASYAADVCLETIITQAASGGSFAVQPKDSCYVEFFTSQPSKSRDYTGVKSVATWENGELILK